MRYMLDTDICSYIVKRKPDKVHARFLPLHRDDVCISVITYAELLHGMKRLKPHSQQMFSLQDFLRGMAMEPWAEPAAEQFADTAHNLLARGHPIGTMDMQIAAHALALNCILVTNNEKHFRRVPGLKLENWTV